MLIDLPADAWYRPSEGPAPKTGAELVADLRARDAATVRALRAYLDVAHPLPSRTTTDVRL